MRYKVVTVGGTFDHLHKGHKTILRKAFAISEKVVVGVTSDAFAQKARNDNLIGIPNSYEGFVGRRRGVEDFLRGERLRERAEIVKIDDMFGPLREVKSQKSKVKNRIEAMVVTRETRGNAEKINQWRRERNLRELDIVEVEMVPAEDGEPISSARIRAGDINREGVVYGRHKLWGRLPREMREELRRPLGEVYSEDSLARMLGTFSPGRSQETTSKFDKDSSCSLRENLDGQLLDQENASTKFSIPFEKILSHSFLGGSRTGPIISVGDVSTKRFIDAGIKPDIAVFDLKVRRKRVFDKPSDVGIGEDYKIVKITNPAGGITKQLYDFFKARPVLRRGRAFANLARPGLARLQGYAVWIDGEEDLVALPAILFAPLQSAVVYGQPPSSRFKVQGSREEKYKQGLVVVEVTEEEKEKIFGLLQRFER